VDNTLACQSISIETSVLKLWLVLCRSGVETSIRSPGVVTTVSWFFFKFLRVRDGIAELLKLGHNRLFSCYMSELLTSLENKHISEINSPIYVAFVIK
jgi:hypothetical protein